MSLPRDTSDTEGTFFEFGGVQLLDCRPAEAVRLVLEAVHDDKPLAVHLCNAYTVTLAAKDREYADALNCHSLNLVDGRPVAWHFRLLTGRRAHGPVRGPSFMRRILDEPGLRHFLYGGTHDVLADLRTEIANQHPAATVSGATSPPFRPLDDADLAELIAELHRTRADVVWVGLGTPKQDHLLAALASSHRCVGIGVGAAFDFISGHKREAPPFLNRLGLEWAYRLATEPRRLWKRYLIGNPAFIRLSARDLWQHKRKAAWVTASGRRS